MPEDCEEDQRLLRRGVVALQAHARGYLVRQRLQNIKREYENIVKEIEGNLDWLEWNGHFLPRPVFHRKSGQKLIKAKELNDQEPRTSQNQPHEKDVKFRYQEVLLSEKECSPAEVVAETEPGDKQLAGKPSGNAGHLPGENEESKDHSSVSSEWSSAVLEMETRLSEEPNFQNIQEMPQTMPDLQCYRKHLAMELLWLQQAITSRKNYLILKQRLGSPE